MLLNNEGLKKDMKERVKKVEKMNKEEWPGGGKRKEVKWGEGEDDKGDSLHYLYTF